MGCISILDDFVFDYIFAEGEKPRLGVSMFFKKECNPSCSTSAVHGNLLTMQPLSCKGLSKQHSTKLTKIEISRFRFTKIALWMIWHSMNTILTHSNIRERYVRGRRKIKTNGFYVWCWRSWIVQGAVRKLKTKLCWIYRWSQKKLSGSNKIFVAKTFQIKRVKCVNF